jgi:(2Fe-2S) ferredoxin
VGLREKAGERDWAPGDAHEGGLLPDLHGRAVAGRLSEGTWYSKVTPMRFERILQEHLLQGNPVEDWIVARNDLQPGPQPGPVCESGCEDGT